MHPLLRRRHVTCDRQLPPATLTKVPPEVHVPEMDARDVSKELLQEVYGVDDGVLQLQCKGVKEKHQNLE